MRPIPSSSTTSRWRCPCSTHLFPPSRVICRHGATGLPGLRSTGDTEERSPDFRVSGRCDLRRIRCNWGLDFEAGIFFRLSVSF